MQVDNGSREVYPCVPYAFPREGGPLSGLSVLSVSLRTWGASNRPPAEPPRLLDRLRFALRTKHYAYRTEQAYVHWVRRFILHHGRRHPQEMGGPEIEAFLTRLAVAGQRDDVEGQFDRVAIDYDRQVLTLDPR